MAYDTPFKFLNSDEVAYLTSYNVPDDKSVYLDCLAVMHDEVTDHSSVSNHSRFRRKERQSLLHAYGKLQNNGVRDNAETNISTAQQLSIQARSQMISSYVSRTLVDRYIEALLEQYRILKNPRIP